MPAAREGETAAAARGLRRWGAQPMAITPLLTRENGSGAYIMTRGRKMEGGVPVSYTHLTLPTILLV
eukprot:7501726-Pyramimonas_sp.AAC.1